MVFKNIALLDENFEVQQGWNLVTEGQQITYVGPQLPQDAAGPVVDGANRLLAPGFYNTHCHLPMVLLRGYGEGLPLHRWLTERMFPFEDLLTEEDVYWGGLLGIAELVASGAVSITDMYMLMPGLAKALEESGFKGNLSHGCSASKGENTRFSDVNGYKGLHYLMDYVTSHPDGRIIADASIHAEYTSCETLVREIAEFAAEKNLRMQVHLSETKKEHEEAKTRRGGRTAARWFYDCGVFNQPTTAAHCVWVEDGDIQLLAEKGVTVAHCPSSNLKLGSGIAPVKAMTEAGVHITIGTDGAASNNNLNMLEEVNLASMLQKGATGDPLFMGTAATLRCATVNGALAQGRQNCGLLKAGYKADLVMYNLDRPNMLPAFDLAANLLYAAGSSEVMMTVIDGRVVYQEGEFPTIDIEKAKYHAQRIADEKLAQLGGR